MERALAGKTALVTGGSRGLGQAIAEKLAGEGALVAVNYAENHAAADATVARIAVAGGQAFAVQARLGGEAGAVKLAKSDRGGVRCPHWLWRARHSGQQYRRR